MFLILHVTQCLVLFLVIQSFQRSGVLFKQDPTTSLSLAGDHQIPSAPGEVTVIIAHLFMGVKDRRLVHFHKVCPCLQIIILIC